MFGESVISHLGKHKYAYLLVAVIVLINLPVLAALIENWAQDGNYSHGFLIIPVSIFLFWRKRGELRFPARPSGWGAIVFGLGAIGLILGTAADEFFTTRVSIIVLLIGTSLYYLGSTNFRKVWFAFVFLFFMVPIPAVIYFSATFPMQILASKMTAFSLHIIGVPAIRQGNIIHLPEYSLEVVEACSGLRGLMTLMALSALYGYLTLPGKILPVILFLAAVPIAIVTNVVRLVFTAVGSYAISTSLAESFLHEVSGILVFITALVLVVLTGAVLRWIGKGS
jgi:exosortase